MYSVRRLAFSSSVSPLFGLAVWYLSLIQKRARWLECRTCRQTHVMLDTQNSVMITCSKQLIKYLLAMDKINLTILQNSGWTKCNVL